ncbi:MBL fold metallo-hydrolase [Dermatobacter hominis]|uniref:MBL fold metallo-hydrolase n=1 Tax=Dermatobacter hominis TaxID=2884263 RepID=UPI001D114154|nr:MBL fold metallo-hydrolase [Dermatobacter hominis]UDY34918.1 MBL fold metallo-hydrolase [Dermatobacter hominis]
MNTPTSIDVAPGQPILPDIPAVEPYQIAPDTYLIPNLVPAQPGTFVMANSLVILAEEPVVVDTGAPMHREQWLANVGSVVDLDDVRWVFLSHDDGDHIGNMHPLLDAAPNATVVTNFFSNERAAMEPDRAMPLHRQQWLEAGSSFDAGDRRLHLFRPPIFDGPTTRGLYDEVSGVMWAVDSFAALTTGAVYDAPDVPSDLYDETFMLFNSLVSPWHEWLSPEVYGRHVDSIEAIGATTIATAHGPVLRGSFIPGAFDRVRALAGRPNIAAPGQEALDAMLAAALVEPAA